MGFPRQEHWSGLPFPSPDIQLTGPFMIQPLLSSLDSSCSVTSHRICCNVDIKYFILLGEGNGKPLQYSCLENPRDGGAWWATVHGVATSWSWLSDFTFTFHFHAMEKEMATHSSVLSWRIQGTAEPGGLLSMGSHRVGYDWSNLAAAAAGVYYRWFISGDRWWWFGPWWEQWWW